MTARRSSGSKGTSGRRRRKAPPKPKSSLPSISLTLDQWLDLLGLGLILLALLTFLSFLSTQGALTGWWLGVLRTIFGWGVFAVPLGLCAVGLWLILRRFEDKRPHVEPEVIVGIALAFLAALASLHLLAGLLYDEALGILADEGLGGGHVGLLLDNLLLDAVGGWGTAVVLLALWVIALIFAFGVTVVELARFARRLWDWMRGRGSLRPATGAQPDLIINAPANHSRAARSAQPRPAGREGAAQAEPRPARPEPTSRSATPAQRPTERTPQPAPLGPTPPTGPLFPRTHIIGGQQAWQLPALEAVFESGGEQELSETEIRERAQIIEATLRSFGVPGRVTEVNRGPVITQFGVEPGFIEGRSGKKTKVKVSRISALADDLALALAAQRIRIETPVPGKSIVGIEVPNADVALVALRDVIESEEFEELRKKTPLPLALGQDVSGQAVVADLTAMPHLLIAGTTGSGKSVCINAILACLLSFNTPDQIKLILVDPKRVELVPYNGIPHLLVPVIVDLERVVGILQWVTREMDGRYRKFAKLGARNIADFNQRVAGREDRGQGPGAQRSGQDEEPLPYIIVVVDELADLMMLAPDETERTICRLAQMARATGIHLVLATQRPSVDVVTGLIKANFPARISFAVASSVDSRVVLDTTGAERLLGRGDMLYMSPESGQPLRLQGAFVSDQELHRLVRHWKGVRGVSEEEQAPPEPAVQPPLWEEMREQVQEKSAEDMLLNDAIAVVQEAGRASISLLQRRLRIGYTRAARLIDMMEEKGVVGPATGGSYAREVLLDEQE
jgi:S-DNA-T family DNA segregation ATPase FtsK/SpoIIIE